MAVKNGPIGQTQEIITPGLGSDLTNLAWSASPGSAEDDLLSLPSLMISVVEPFVTVCGERFHLFTHQQTLSSGLLGSQIFTCVLWAGVGQIKGTNFYGERESES